MTRATKGNGEDVINQIELEDDLPVAKVDGGDLFTVLGRTTDIYQVNVPEKGRSALSPSVLVKSRSLKDCDFTFLMWLLRNSGHNLLEADELKLTFPPTRGIRNTYSGHIASASMDFSDFKKATDVSLDFVKGIDKSFSVFKSNLPQSLEESFRCALTKS